MIIKFFDFDGCIMNSPLPEDGKIQYEKAHGTPYPHAGWWGRKESLCPVAFDIQPIYQVDKVLREAIADPGVRTVLMTNRLGKLEKHVKHVLDRQGYVLDMYTYMHGPDNKGQRIRRILTDHYPSATGSEFYDDDVRHLRDTRDAIRGFVVPIKLFKIERGEIIPFN